MVTIAAVSGLVAAVGIYHRLVASRGAADRPGAAHGVVIVVAKSGLPRGTVLGSEHLASAARTPDEMPTGVFTEPRLLLGRITKDHVRAGEPILESSLIPASGRQPLTSSLPPGYRAVGVFVDPRGGIQRVLQPGHHVDVVVTMDDEDGIASSRLLVQDVEVLAVPDAADATTRFGASSASSGLPVTLAVTPAAAEQLALAMHIGTIHLLVRNYADDALTQTFGVTEDFLMPQAAGQDPATAYRVVEVLKGQERFRQRFHAGTGATAGPHATGARAAGGEPPEATEADATTPAPSDATGAWE